MAAKSSNVTEPKEKVDDAPGGGKQPAPSKPQAPDPTAPPDEARFTQADLDRVIADRIKRERAKYEDYDALKDQATKWAEYEEAQKSELEKAIGARDQAIRDRDEALQEANDRLLRAAFLAEAGKVGAKHPEDAYLLADLSNASIADDGFVSGVDIAVQGLVESGRLVLTGRPPAPALDEGAGSGDTQPVKVRLSAEEEAVARKMGLTPEQYAKYKE